MLLSTRSLLGNLTSNTVKLNGSLPDPAYAGRRRFITQYVELFPLPNPVCEEAKTIISLAKDIYAKTPSTEADQIAVNLDELIWRVFGLHSEKVSG